MESSQPSAISSCRFVEHCLSADRMRKQSPWGAVFLGHPLSLTSLLYGLQFADGTRAHSKQCCNLGFAEHQLEVGPYPDLSNVAILGADQCSSQ